MRNRLSYHYLFLPGIALFFGFTSAFDISAEHETIMKSTIFVDSKPQHVTVYPDAYSLVIDTSSVHGKLLVDSLKLVYYEEWRKRRDGKNPPLELHGCGFPLFYLNAQQLSNLDISILVRGIYYETTSGRGAVLTSKVSIRFADNTPWPAKDSIFTKYGIHQYEMLNGSYLALIPDTDAKSILEKSKHLVNERAVGALTNHTVDGFDTPQNKE